MTIHDSVPNPPNYQTELAKERNRIAADRTVLSWIRLSLTLIGIGFGIDQAVDLIYANLGNAIHPTHLSHILGILLVGLGVYTIILAAIDYQGELCRLEQPDYVYTPRYRLGDTVAIAVIAIALLCFVSIGLKIPF